MAEIKYTNNNVNGNTQIVTWADVTDADTFQRWACDGVYQEISVHVYGTFGGATVSIFGANYVADGAALTKMPTGAAETAIEAVFSILERPLYITPTHAGGAGETVSIKMVVRR